MRHKEIKAYYDNGQMAEHYWIDPEADSQEFIGDYKQWYYDGTPKGTVRFNDEGILHGVSIGYYPNGQLQLEHNYDNDLLVGLYREYGDDGSLIHCEYLSKSGETLEDLSEYHDQIDDEFRVALKLKHGV